MGGEVSIAIDSNSVAHVSYHELGSGQLRYANNRGGHWSTEIVDPQRGAGLHASLELDSLGKPLIVYYDASSRLLRIASRRMSGREGIVAEEESSKKKRRRSR